MVAYVTFLRDVACQKLLNLANASRSYSQNNTGTVFFETRCIAYSIVILFTPMSTTLRRLQISVLGNVRSVHVHSVVAHSYSGSHSHALLLSCVLGCM